MKSRKTYTKEILEPIVKSSLCLADVFRGLNLKINGGSYPWMRNLLKSFDIRTDHFNENALNLLKAARLKKLNYRDFKEPLENGKRLKSKDLVKHLSANGVPRNCSSCGLNEWMDQPIVLDVDHINGDCHDNSTKNLQYLCPNCHRQKTSLERSATKNKCLFCGIDINKKSSTCRSCAAKKTPHEEKIIWPSKDKLKRLVWEKPLIALALDLGVSDVAIRKRCKKLNIELPEIGFWLKGKNRRRLSKGSKGTRDSPL